MLQKQEREELMEEERRLAYAVKAQVQLGVPALFGLVIGGCLAANHYLGTHFEWVEILLLVLPSNFLILDNWLQLRKVRKKLDQQ